MAPQVSDTSDVVNRVQGEIVFDWNSSTEGTFMAYDGDEWIDLSAASTVAGVGQAGIVSSGVQTLDGLKTFDDGIRFENETLDSYNEFTGTLTISDSDYTIDTDLDDIYCTRVGKSVTCKFRLGFTWTSPADSVPTFTTGMDMAPTNGVSFTFLAHDGTSWGIRTGFLDAFGEITLYKTIGLGGFTSSGTWSTGHSLWGNFVVFSYTTD